MQWLSFFRLLLHFSSTVVGKIKQLIECQFFYCNTRWNWNQNRLFFISVFKIFLNENISLFLKRSTTEWISKKRGYEGDDFLFRTVMKIRKIQFSQFLHTSASKFSHGRFPNHSLLPAEFEFLFYIVLLRSKILVLFSWDFQAGNSKF